MNKNPKYLSFTRAEQFQNAGLLFIEPMTAKEIETEEEQDVILADSNYYVEEKFDGTRGLLHFVHGGTRCFSRRVSVKTGWFCENSDSVPQLRDLDVPSLGLTILDGEMFIPGRPFKDVAGILNCKYDKAIARQEELGWIVLHAFDILFYRGQDLRNLPLSSRKEYLHKAIAEANSPYIKEVPYYAYNVPLNMDKYELEVLLDKKELYPHLYAEVQDNLIMGNSSCSGEFTHRAYYEYIVMNGGEGVIVKPQTGRYFSKRGREYQKIKKFLTRDVIIIGFTMPTKVYTGKFPNNSWDYWVNSEDKRMKPSDFADYSAEVLLHAGFIPVTKHWYEEKIGNITFAVLANDEIPKKAVTSFFCVTDIVYRVVDIGECAGFDEEMRDYLTENADDMLGTVIEVKANELFKDTGKMRHPRFLRLRPDKDMTECTWTAHINS